MQFHPHVLYRKWAIYISVFSIGLGLLSIFTLHNVVETVLRIVLFVIMIIYFSSANIKEQFEKKETDMGANA
jgi:hypothetical protein